MEISIRKILGFAFYLCISSNGFSQTAWTQKASFPGIPRYCDASFTIGHYAFVGIGYGGGYLSDFWKWNQTSNTWSAIPSYPGAGNLSSTAFSIEGKGYVGLGWNGSGASDLWRYDTISNSWTRMANFPGVARYDCDVFVIGHKAYFLGGSIAGPPYLQDVWVYDAHTNMWTQKSNWPGGQVEETITFAIGNHGYAGDGWYPGCTRQMFEYDTTSDSWTAIAAPPPSIGITENPDTWVIGSRAYVCTGGNCSAAGLRDGWMYDTVTKSWCEFTYIAGAKLSRGNGVAFTINNRGYFCTGQDTNLNNLADLWEYTPSTKINVNDTSNLCIGDSVHFSDSTTYFAQGWSWSFPGGSPAFSNLQNPAVYYTNSGIYNVQLIITTCGSNDTVSRTIHIAAGAIGGIGILGRSPVCAGTPDTLYSWGGASYSWSDGETTSSIIVSPNANTTYTVQVSNGCSKDTSITVTVNPLPSVSITGNNSICPGVMDTLVASGGGTYLWSTGSTNSSLLINPSVTTTFSLDVNNGTCTKDTSVTIEVQKIPIASINGPQTICHNSPITLTADGGGTYKWFPDSALNCDTCQVVQVNPRKTVTYSLVVSNGSCTDTTWAKVVVDQIPSSTACCNDTIQMGDTAHLSIVANGKANCVWSPNTNIDCDTCFRIEAYPQLTTTYTVSVTDSEGCEDLDTLRVFVEPCSRVWIPNAFSPYWGSVNDVFAPRGVCMIAYRMYIFDRWGSLIYQTNNSQAWNGKLKNGNIVQEDTYVYMIQVTDGFLRLHDYYGRVTVIK